MLLTLSSQFIVAQVSSPVYSFHHLGSSDGLSSSQYNYHVFQDSVGFAWISSLVGLNRFDGYRVKQYRPDTTQSGSLLNLQASQSAFGEVSGGGMWFTNDVALTRYWQKQDIFEHFQFDLPDGEKATNTYWWCYVDSQNDRVFTSGNRHLFFLDVTPPGRQSLLDTIHVGVRDRMQITGKGEYILLRNFFGSPRLEIRYYSVDGLLREPLEFNGPKERGIRDAYYFSDSLIWVATRNGLYKLNTITGQWSDEITNNGRSFGYLESICVDREGNLILGTATEGIYRYNPVANRSEGPFMTNLGGNLQPFTPSIVRMYLNEDETLWVSVKDDGVYYANIGMDKTSTLRIRAHGDNQNIVRFALGEGGDMWLAGPKMVTHITDRDTTQYALDISGQELEQVKSFLVDRSGTVWLGTLKMLLHLPPGEKTFRQYALPYDGMVYPGYNDLKELPNGELLVATNRESLLRISADRTHCFKDPTSCIRPRILGGTGNDLLVTTLRDSFFVGKLIGADAVFRVDTVFLGLPYVTAIVADEAGDKYWIGTHAGLFQITRSGARRYTLSSVFDGTDQPVVHAMDILDDRLVMSLTTGLESYQSSTGIRQKLQLSDGLQGNEFTLRSVLTDTLQQTIFFGGKNGVDVLTQRSFISTAPPPRPTITDILINYESEVATDYSPNKVSNVAFIEHLRLPYNKNSIELHVSAFDFSDPANCQYRFEVLGSENNTERPVTDQPFAILTDLREGEYKINIYATNSDNQWSGPRSLTIIILPPWYRTWWAYTLYALLVAAAGWGVNWYRLRNIREIEKEQLRTAQAEALAAETETSVLRLQMNPHFIFNSLNSINSFIMTGRKLEAHEYLMKFADVIRDILNRSTQPLTRLDQAIDLLRDYMEAEQMRMGDKLRFHIEEDPELDTFSYYLPTMIVQPFIENSIKHGIGGLPQGGLITLRFKMDEEQELLLVEVEDDGRGRRMQGGRTGKHASKALGITNKRMDQLNAVYATASSTSSAPASAPKKYRYEIKDLKHPDGSPRGTLVLLYLPLTYPRQHESSRS
ncbi:Histidine kinase [Neolewinella agarilytica]|uniref:Histidine kinase n=2 Tax=Neolewinella agarilytica TaxID=478744 RepID=A0A1H9MSP8_9BACT|nr:Histidine kinase [Neolewinella agarilytica]